MKILWVALVCGLAHASVASAQTVERIAAAKVVKVGFVGDHAPFASRSAGEVPEGYSIDVCSKVVEDIAGGLGPIRTEYVETSLADAFNAVADGRLDLVCSAITITLKRRELVDFSEPIFVTGASAIFRKDSPRDVRELFSGERLISRPRSPELRPYARSKIGVRSDTSTEAVLERAIAAGSYQVDLVGFTTHSEGLKALESREIDAYFADHALLADMLGKARDASGIVLAERRFTNEFYGIVIPRGDPDLRLMVDMALSRLYSDPEFPSLLAKHFGGFAAAVHAQIRAHAILE
jgi:ABC-type amino acid transport substrate-binding protein